jgi:hypothetical protein
MPSGALVGHPVSVETRRKIADSRRRSDNSQWKGETAGYSAKHTWLWRNMTKTGTCTNCGAVRKTEWANVSGEYHHDPADYVELCVPCHRRRDLARYRAAGTGRFANLTHLEVKG